MAHSISFPVIIRPYDSAWPRLFDEERVRIDAAIHDYIGSIEHIGSTAVPGLAAKPVIDILIGAHSLAEAPCFIPPLQAMGYIYIEELEKQIPERRYLQKVSPAGHTHHLHIAEPSSPFYIEHLHFRDVLRAHPEVAQEYAELKFRLAKQFRNDRPAYTEAKNDFIKKVLLIP
jgi:GrpB-like predicted nucleotidyltransferase (UPF0157 family)